MTKSELREWFQNLLREEFGDSETELLPNEDYGDLWRKIEDEGLLEEIRVPYAVDHVGHAFVFKLSDGMLALQFETGIEGETQLWIPDGNIAGFLRDYSQKELDTAIGAARVTLNDLTILSHIL